jgi:hypothetical protein
MRFLTADQKRQCVSVCKELCQITSDNAAFLSMVIAVDKSWIYGYDSEEKEQSSQWKMKSNVKSMLIIFLDIKGIVHKEFFLQAKQTITLTTVMFYGNCLKICEDFAPNFSDKRSGCYIITTHHLMLLFSPENFLTKTA